jgi:hypothetical protein
VVAHLSCLIQGPIHLALAFAIGMVSFDSGLTVAAAGCGPVSIAGSLTPQPIAGQW